MNTINKFFRSVAGCVASCVKAVGKFIHNIAVTVERKIDAAVCAVASAAIRVLSPVSDAINSSIKKLRSWSATSVWRQWVVAAPLYALAVCNAGLTATSAVLLVLIVADLKTTVELAMSGFVLQFLVRMLIAVGFAMAAGTAKAAVLTVVAVWTSMTIYLLIRHVAKLISGVAQSLELADMAEEILNSRDLVSTEQDDEALVTAFAQSQADAEEAEDLLGTCDAVSVNVVDADAAVIVNEVDATEARPTEAVPPQPAVVAVPAVPSAKERKRENRHQVRETKHRSRQAVLLQQMRRDAEVEQGGLGMQS